MISTSIVAYLVLFVGVGAAFLFCSMLLGRFLRPKMPTREKLATYECGEPAVGTSRVKFDLRFYVVALLFIVFEVEIAFFFPWAVVFGSATTLMDPDISKAVVAVATDQEGSALGDPRARTALKGLGLPEFGSAVLPSPGESAEVNHEQIQASMRKLAIVAMIDVAIFFAVLMVGFIYVWYRGDLDWVKAYKM